MKSLLRPKRAMWSMRLAQRGFTMAGILCLGYCLLVLLNVKFYQARAARNFENKLQLTGKRTVSTVTQPWRTATVNNPQEGGIVGRLEIPRIGVSIMVVEGTDDGDLKRAAGHIPGTALPGNAGNVGIAGHRDTFFRPLRHIQRDDTIDLVSLQAVDHYRVVSTRVVQPEDVQVLYPTGRDVLTLVTCFPFDYVGSAPRRFIVRAERLP
jgi:sortase A